MKISVDKFIIILLLFSCSNNCINNKNDFKKNLVAFEKIKEYFFNNSQKNKLFNKAEIKANIDSISFKVLKELKVDNISKINKTLIFTFKIPYKQTWFEKKFDSKIKFCNVFLFYGKNNMEKEKIMNYEQYVECQIIKEKINDDWTFIFQKWYCSD